MKSKKLRTIVGSGNDIDLGADFYIEMRGQNNLAVYSCRGIAEYSPKRIILHLHKAKLSINGVGLLCDSYTNGAVLVSGQVCSVEFTEDS